MPTPEVDVGRMLEVLARHRVEYIVIGGYAIELHDVAVPPTRDVDITPEASSTNLRHLAAALVELEATFRVPDGPPGGVPVPGGITPEWLSGMITLTLVTAAGPLDISFIPDGTSGYDDLFANRVEIAVGERVIPVASLDDVIRSKEAAGREKDFRVLPALRAHLRRRG